MKTRVFYQSNGTNDDPVLVSDKDDPQLATYLGNMLHGDVMNDGAKDIHISLIDMTDEEVAAAPNWSERCSES